MPVFKAAKIPRKETKPEDTLSAFCYYFPQYTYAEARKLPFKQIKFMLKAVRKEQARNMLDFLRVFSGSQSKHGASNVLSYFKKILEE